MSWVEALYPPTAYDLCAKKIARETEFEGVEDPHTHPEPPTDGILVDFFCPNILVFC